MKNNLLYFSIFLFSITFLLFFSYNLSAQDLNYNDVKAKGILLDSDLVSHQMYIVLGNLTSDYLISDIYIYGKFFLDFSQLEFGKIIYKSDSSKIFLQFASYKSYYNQNEQYPYCEKFQIQISIDDILKIIENKDETIYFQFTGKYETINARLNKKLISSLEKLSIDDEKTNIDININTRPFSLFLILYPINIYYSLDNQNPVINEFASSLLFHNNSTLELGIYFKTPFLSAISIYFSYASIFDWEDNYEVSRLFGIKIYLTVFDFSESLFLRFSSLIGFLVNFINSDSLPEYCLGYIFSLNLGIPITSYIEYFASISLGKVEYSNVTFLFQMGIIINLF